MLTICASPFSTPKRKSQKTERAEALTRCSPDCPYGIATSIRLEWEKYAEGKTGELEERYARQPVVLGALGREYLERERFDDAERLLPVYLSLSPDTWAYEGLADIYFKRGDIDKWQSTLDESLTKEDYGLSHAVVQAKIARHFMSEKKWEKARPYAMAAAETGAGWAVDVAIECLEALQEWDEAEKLVRYMTERYQDYEAYWYLWCAKTGHGDINAAYEMADAQFQRIRPRATTLDLASMGTFYWIADKRDEAIAVFREALDREYSQATALKFVILLDENDRATERDAELNKLLEAKLDQSNTYRKSCTRLAGLMKTAIQKQSPESVDQQGLENLVANAAPEDAQTVLFLMGCFCAKHGANEQAIQYFTRSTQLKPKAIVYYAAMARLRVMQDGQGA